MKFIIIIFIALFMQSVYSSQLAIYPGINFTSNSIEGKLCLVISRDQTLKDEGVMISIKHLVKDELIYGYSTIFFSENTTDDYVEFCVDESRIDKIYIILDSISKINEQGGLSHGRQKKMKLTDILKLEAEGKKGL